MLDLLKRQAKWLNEVKDYKGAAEMYWAAKDYMTAIQVCMLVCVYVCVRIYIYIYINVRARRMLL